MSVLLIIAATAGISGCLGWALALHSVEKRQARATARRELAMQCRSPLDLAPADFARSDRL